MRCSRRIGVVLVRCVLLGVSCVTPDDCVVVGEYGNSKLNPLVESWNGGNWSIVPSPTPADGGTFVSVSCPKPAYCAAVGNYQTASGGNKNLAEIWNGTRWSITPIPNKPVANLNGVSCSSSTSCMAVGSYSKNHKGDTLVESWNGKLWKFVPSPSIPEVSFDPLAGVSCVSSSRCVAVGNANMSLVEVWNGKTWSVESSGNKGEGDYLVGVSCTSPTKCVAAGCYTYDGPKEGFVTKTLVESS